MFRTLTALVVLGAASGPLLHADTLDVGGQPPSPAVTAPVVSAAPPAAQGTPPSLGRHHIETSWYGFSRAGNDLWFPYLDARRGEGGFFNYRYSFTPHLDLVVDGRGWVNDLDDDSMFFHVKSQVLYSGFGARYTFDHVWQLFPYLQGNIYRADVQVSSKSKQYSPFQRPEVFWDLSGQGWGFGLNGGAEIRLGKLVSIPVDVAYCYCKPRLSFSGYRDELNAYHQLYCNEYRAKEMFNASNITVSAGIGFNWGRVK